MRKAAHDCDLINSADVGTSPVGLIEPIREDQTTLSWPPVGQGVSVRAWDKHRLTRIGRCVSLLPMQSAVGRRAEKQLVQRHAALNIRIEFQYRLIFQGPLGRIAQSLQLSQCAFGEALLVDP